VFRRCEGSLGLQCVSNPRIRRDLKEPLLKIVEKLNQLRFSSVRCRPKHGNRLRFDRGFTLSDREPPHQQQR
jgi:hypothetical protein